MHILLSLVVGCLVTFPCNCAYPFIPCSTFADCYLDGFTKQQLVDYDKLLNGPDNDWDIYYWITGKLTTPDCYDNHIMELLKKHALNCNKEQRYSQPELKTPTSDT